MEISTLKDVKEALKDIPDEELERFGFGVESFDGGEKVELLWWGSEEEIQGMDKASKAFDKYPQLKDINKLIRNIIKEENKVTNKDDSVYERQDPISSEEED